MDGKATGGFVTTFHFVHTYILHYNKPSSGGSHRLIAVRPAETELIKMKHLPENHGASLQGWSRGKNSGGPIKGVGWSKQKGVGSKNWWGW